MNLLFLHSSSDLYGASKILLDVTVLCKKNGHTPTVVVSQEGPLTAKLTNEGIEVVKIPLGVLRRKYMNPGGMLNRLMTMFKAYRQLRNICQEKKIDLIYSNTTGILVGTFVAGSLGIRHIWHVHEIIEQPALLHRIISRMLNRNVNEIWVVSAAVKKHWSKGVNPDKIKVLYNGVDLTAFEHAASGFRKELSIPEDALVIGMMGRVHYWKGQDYFLEIAGILHQAFPEVHFLLVGDPFPGYEYLYQNMNAIIEKNHLQNQTHIVGYREDISHFYHSLDIFVLPSLQPDPAPAVVTEAMASGIPVVITNQGGAVEMIEPNISGLIIPIGRPEEAAKIIAPLVKDKLFRKEMGGNGLKRVRDFFSRTHFHENVLRLISQ